MKKLLSIVALLLTFTMGAYAQGTEEYKKSWDFTKGLSDETIADLNADTQNWASNGTDGEGVTNNWKNAVKQSATEPWKANGNVIAELKDLLIDIGSNKDNSVHLATTKLRLTRKNTTITFPSLKNGQKIMIQGRSANGDKTDRGIAPVQNYIQFQAEESSPQYDGKCIFVGNKVEGSEGTYTFVWKVVTDSEEPQTVQFKLTPDAGIDFTLFQIDNGDAPAVVEAQPVAYLFSGEGDEPEDLSYIMMAGDSRFAVTAINMSTAPTLASLTEAGYQAVVISPTVTDASSLKDVIAFLPVVNLTAANYASMGLGSAVPTEVTELTIAAADNAIFEGFDATIAYDGPITAVQLGEYFANDAVLATAGENVAIHAHNAKRNAYYLIPTENASESVYATLIPQTVQAAIDSKKDVQAVGTPVISTKQDDGFTTVTLSAANAKQIYYTLDGSDPTTASTLYAEPFVVTTTTTVKAFATGDGYTPSKIAEKEITISHRAATPTFSINREAGKSTITINGQEGAKIYFNFNGATTAALSQAYTEPIELTEPVSIYALAEGNGLLTSELATEFIDIDGIDNTNIRLDEIAHFDANETDWFMNDAETSGIESQKASAYYFWGKSAWNYYTSEEDHREIVKDELGNPIKSQINPEEDSVIVYYKPDPNALRVIMPLNANGWMLKSSGQVLTGELQLAPEAGVGNGNTGRFAEEAIDLITTPTKGVITFGGKVSGDPYTASIETTDKLTAPFDIIVMCGNGNNGSAANMEVQVSADGQTWTKVGDVKMAATQRYIKRTRLSYNEEGQVYLRVAHVSGATKAQVYDIIVLNNGEESKKYATGISEVNTQQEAKVVGIYSINGVRHQQLHRGLNIVAGADGTVRKVMVK